MRAVGIILAGGNNNKMRELTQRRAVAAMPIAGSYRAIDFALIGASDLSFRINKAMLTKSSTVSG